MLSQLIIMKTKYTAAFMLMSAMVAAQSATAKATSPGFSFDINLILVLFALFLIVPIIALSNTFTTAAKRYYAEKLKSRTLRVLLPIGVLLVSSSLIAQGNSPANTIGISSSTMTILLICVIGVELLLIILLAQKTNQFLQKREAVLNTEPRPTQSPLAWLRAKWTAMNFKPIEEEHTLDTGHNYDGIRELNNVTPPWFTTAFVLSIIFAGVYLYRYHIAKSAPLMVEEYQMEIAKANLEHEEYLKTQASNIDESNVAILTGADLDAGKKVFTTLCAACHRTDGGGAVGPNMTDDYWLHGGSLQDIFKTIKYGVPDKGMISWKEQLTPQQIAQVANYIVTLRGTNPPDPKEKQGELFTPATTTATDTTKSTAPSPTNVSDSTNVSAPAQATSGN